MANHDKILESVSKALVDRESWKVPYKVQIRPSSLPFCQTQFLFAELDPIEWSAKDSFMEQVFTSIGNVAHDLIQTYLGREGILYGRWQCKKCYWNCSPALGSPYCGDKRLQWTRGEDLDGQPIGPDKSTCNNGFATRYREFKFKDPISGIEGSCDGIIIVAGWTYILEIKTKPSGSAVKALKAPDDPHIAQASTYAELCKLEDLGLTGEVAGVAFCYVPRDYPHKMRFIFHPRDASTLNNLRVDVPEAFSMLETGKLENAKRVCPTPQYGEKVRYCPYAMQCFRPDRDSNLKVLWEEKQNADITEFTGQFRFLSNFTASKVTFEGVVYPTVEHAYQAAKTLDLAERTTILGIDRAGDAKKAGKKLTVRSDWDAVKVKVMAKLVYRKFDKNPELKAKLLSTGNVKLIESNTWGDRFWGVSKGEGENKLGKILMKVRSKLREEAINGQDQ